MPETKKYLLTKETFEKKQEERKQLNSYLHTEIARKIAEARAQGDLSENADYDAAMDEQAEVAAKIKELDEMLMNAEISDVDIDKLDRNKVSLGATVTILDTEFDEEEKYKLVGSTEANSQAGLISNESPVGKALIGKEKGDTVVVPLESGGTITYKIVNIEY